MAKVTVTLPTYPQMLPPDPVEHEGAESFAPVAKESGTFLEVYGANGVLSAAYAPGCWASAVLS